MNVYLADGLCHINPEVSSSFKSFRARIAVDGSLGFSFYRDLACKEGYHGGGLQSDMLVPTFCLTETCDVMSVMCSQQTCGSLPYGHCGRTMTVGGPRGPPPTGNFTTVVLYEDNLCTNPADSVALSIELSCTPQSDHYDPVCAQGGAMFSTTDCTQYYAGGWDDIGVISDVFGDYPHLVMEKYVWCGMVDVVTDVKMYRLDEECYLNAAGNESYRLSLGRSVNITTYTDSNCRDVATETKVRRSSILSGWCMDDEVKFFLANAQTTYSVLAVYEDSTCSGTLVQITFTPTLWCAPASFEKQPCQILGDSLFSMSGCTHDYAAFASTQFGQDSPFVIEESYTWGCGNIGIVTVYSADGICHADMDESSSFKASVDMTGALSLQTFNDRTCNEGRSITTLTKDQLTVPLCMWEPCFNMKKLCAVEDCFMLWWSCYRKLFVGGLGFVPSVGLKTIVAVYEDSSCSPPAVSVTLSNELTCTPQDNHYAPVCVTNETSYAVSDCTQYYSGGWDDIGIISDSFGTYPYLVVEKFVNGWCGTREAITDVVIYRLDDNCYPDAAGITSHRLILGRSVTIAMYADANCMNATTTTTVEQTMLSASAAGTCIDNDKKFFVVNAKPVFSTLTIYEDSTCSGTPSHIIFSRDFACRQVSDPKNASCQAFGNSLFSVSGCTSDYNEFTATAFGVNNPFVIERASLSWTCSDDSVTAYSADGICHVNSADNSGFRARIDSQGTLAFYKFYDAGCTINRDPSYVYSSDLVYQSCMVYECSFLPSLCSHQECNNLSSCRRKLSVGGPSGTPPSGKFTTVAVFEDSSCSSPPKSMSLTNELSCTPQVDHFDPICLKQGAMFSVSDCTQYYAGGWDDFGLINDVFGDSPRLIVEQYAWCGFMDKITGVTVYILDELCHTNSEGTGSYRLTLDQSITITTFTDTNCMDIATVTDVDRSTISSGRCGPEDKKFIVSNAPRSYTVVATFEDSKCSGTPSQISFIPAFGCHGAQDFADAPCESTGNSLFTVSSCTNDYNEFSIMAFGIGNPFVVEHGYLTLDCSSVGLITMYSPDGICHPKPNSNRSFRVSIDSVGTLVFKTFYDSMCQNEQHTRVLDKYQLSLTMCMADNCDLMPSLCAYGNCPWWMCGRKLSIGGLDPVHSFNSAVTVFKDSSCSGIPVQIVIKKQLTCSEPHTCNAVTTTGFPMYQNTECIEDVAAFSKSRFDGVPYLIMEKYKDGSNCEKQKGIVVYKADGLCYYSAADGTSFRVLSSFGGSITFVSYLTTSCDDNEAEVIAIGSKYINTGACYAGKMKLYGNLTALSPPNSPSTCPTPTSTTPTPTPTTSTPTPPSSVDFNQKTREEIMFPTWLWEPTPRRIFENA